MALKVHSLFYYGHIIDDTNNMINFKEGAGVEKTATLPVGPYTLTKFLEVVVAALNAASSLDWSYTLNRSTRVVTLISSGTASLLFGSGATATSSPAELLGFPEVDILNTTSFVGSFGSGKSYAPQFPIQDYKGKNQNKKMVNAVVTKSASGDSVSVQSFGVDRFIKGNFKYINEYPGDGAFAGSFLRESPNALSEIQDFMDYIVEKNPIEFMEDESDPNTFDKVYLESTQDSGNGTSYELIEYIDRDLPGFYETGLLTFKVINLE